METVEIKELVKEQKRFCYALEVPFLMPEGGICWNCGHQIFEDERTAKNAGKQIISGCPHCCRSFCD